MEYIVTQKLVLDFWYLADPFPQILTRKYDCASVAECEKRLFSHKIFFEEIYRKRSPYCGIGI
jgi:hypothetical protein